MLLIQDKQWNYAVPYIVTLKDWANCAEVTCINMHRYRCKMPVFLISLSPILDFQRSVGPYPDRRNQRGLNKSQYCESNAPIFCCIWITGSADGPIVMCLSVWYCHSDRLPLQIGNVIKHKSYGAMYTHLHVLHIAESHGQLPGTWSCSLLTPNI